MFDEFVQDIRAVVAAAEEGRPIESISDFGLLTDEERILGQTLSLLETGMHMVGLSADPVIAEGASASSLSWSY
jgi:hypothetical protein